jgi:uncharacterized membrane protein HdeD (DUF308 family)
MSSRHDGPRGGERIEEAFDERSMLAALGKAAWQLLFVAGLMAAAVGLIALFWPRGTLIVVGVLFGIYLLVSGVVQIATAFSDHTPTAMRVLSVIVGTISILLGLFCFRGALESVLLLSLWIGIGFLLRGIAQTVAAASAPSVPGRGWLIFLGALVAVAGIVMISWPIASITTLTAVGGWWLLIIGVVEIVHAFRLRAAAKTLLG